MPSPGDPPKAQLPAEDAFFDLLIETLENLERPARGQFLQKFFRTIAQLDLTESLGLELWERILTRRQELAESLGKPVPLKTAIVDVLAASNYLRMPILVEYEELKKLQINAATDPLTGLYNRRLFEEYFEKELNRALRYGQHLALVVMDLHRFKEINDRYGHPQGDVLLQSAAGTLRKSLRTSDYAFRIGGDEFALLLPQLDAEQAATLARRVRANYEAGIAPLRLSVPLSLDYGQAVFPEDGDQREVLVRVADERLYQMKYSDRGERPELVPPPREVPAAREVPPPRETPPGEKAAAGETLMPPVSPAARPRVLAPGEVVPRRPAAPTVERRKYERVSLAGTRAYALLGQGTEKTARVLDLGYGGVALQTETPEELAGSFHAVLHVPILPPVRVSLRRIYSLRREGRDVRVGCSFVT